MKKSANPIKQSKSIDILIVLFITFGAVVVFFPFYNTFLISLVTERFYVRHAFVLFPTQITFSQYKYILSYRPLMDGFRVSGIITVVGTAFSMLVSTFMAYGMTKKFPGRNLIMNLIIFSMYFSGGLIPFYVLITKLHMKDSLAVLIIPGALSVFNMILMKNFFNSLPPSLEESASIDGANDITILFKIILPLSMPMLATFSLFFAVEKWNDWFTAMIFIDTDSKRPLQTVLRNLIIDSARMDKQMMASAAGQHFFSAGVKMAAVVVSMLPIMLVYPFLQKYFMKGIMIGAIKS